jgi:hypothetical protein
MRPCTSAQRIVFASRTTRDVDEGVIFERAGAPLISGSPHHLEMNRAGDGPTT